MDKRSIILTQFLKEVDKLTERLTHREMSMFIYEIARTLPENKRENFLNLLMSYEKNQENITSQNIVNNEKLKVKNKIENIKKCLLEIDNGKYILDSEYNSEWDEWDNDEDDEILFSDSNGILKDIDESINLVHKCIDMELYQDGYEIVEIMSVLNVSVEGDYCDYDGTPLNIEVLSEYNLLKNSYEDFVKESLYLTYMANKVQDRARNLYCMVRNFNAFSIIKLKDIVELRGEELPDFNEFLNEWISYLGNEKDKKIEQLLQEAQLMLTNDEIMLSNVRKYSSIHPVLYLQLLELKLASDENYKMFKIGEEAINTIPSTYVVRSKVALLTAEYATRLGENEKMEMYWMEAFRSNSTITNYLRIRFYSKDWFKWQKQLEEVIEEIYNKCQKEEKRKYLDIKLEETNHMYQNDYYIMLFFNNEFEKMYSLGMEKGKAIDWSSTFIKQGLALMLLFLYEGQELEEGQKEMKNRAIFYCNISTEEFFKGTGIHSTISVQELFSEFMKKLKKEVILTKQERETWLFRISKLIEDRVNAIMEGNHRNYYEECAAFIAAFGEVKESLGEPNAKVKIMTRYKSKYYRRIAFKRALALYGMENG